VLDVPAASSCTIFKFSSSLALGIIRVYRFDTCKLLFTKDCINMDKNRLNKGKRLCNNKLVLLNMNMYTESRNKRVRLTHLISIMSIVLGRVSIPQHVPFRLCSCFMNTIAQISKILRFCNCFWVVHCSLLFYLTFT
jgi:hypothetical protein